MAINHNEPTTFGRDGRFMRTRRLMRPITTGSAKRRGGSSTAVIEFSFAETEQRVMDLPVDFNPLK